MNRYGLQLERKDLEHRWKKRIEVSLDVVVRGRDGLMLRGRTRDISADGMFIRLATHAVATTTVVEIELSRCGCLHGWVVHAGKEGIGVIFHSLGDKKQRLLRQLLAESTVTQRK